jgi:hypothetical protein
VLPVLLRSLHIAKENMNKGFENQVTVKRVCERITPRFRRITMRLDGRSSSNNRCEIALVIQPKQFKGMCCLCEKHEHKKKVQGGPGQVKQKMMQEL